MSGILDGHLRKKTEHPSSKHPLAKLKKIYGGLDAFSRHKQMMNAYALYHPGSIEKLKNKKEANYKNDYDILRENHKFLWSAEDTSEAERSWDARLAKRYYDKLFKEYCIADLTQYEKNRVAMRWRIEREVKSGKGQFICGEKHCDVDKALESWEVNFVYVEHGEKKNALVKLRLCPKCSAKLNYHSMKKRVSKQIKKEARKRKHDKKKEKRKAKRSKDESSSSESSSDDESEELPTTSAVKEEVNPAEAERAKQNEEAAKIWSKNPQDDERTAEQEMDEFIDDLLF